MGFSNRSIRHRIAATALACVALFVAGPLSLVAQENLQPQGEVAGLDTTEPVVVVTLGSVGKLMQDVNYLTSVIGQAQAGGLFTMMAGTFTQGVDTTQPIGVIVPLVNVLRSQLP